ncbi:hypothetical protein BDF22DRAFT_746486 [Syncephalis plumigaleata]|nr:hypothetical protein BDF22DRAFT_746486 [Syncephalis plumigaleata]
MKRQSSDRHSSTIDRNITSETTEQAIEDHSKRFKSTDITVEHQSQNNNNDNDNDNNGKRHHDPNSHVSLVRQCDNTEIEGELAGTIDLILSHPSGELQEESDIDATDIDRTIRWTFIRLNVGADHANDDQVMMRFVDFTATIQRAIRRSGTSNDCQIALDMLNRAASQGLLFEGYIDEHIIHHHLKITDTQLSLLVTAGFLVTLDASRHALTVPNMGRFAIQLRNGRRELAQWLRRRRYRQAPFKQVLEKQLRRATLISNQYLVWSMLGNDQIAKFNTASGWFLRLTDKGDRLCQ